MRMNSPEHIKKKEELEQKFGLSQIQEAAMNIPEGQTFYIAELTDREGKVWRVRICELKRVGDTLEEK